MDDRDAWTANRRRVRGQYNLGLVAVMNILLLRPAPGNERFGLGPFFRIEPLGMEYVAAALETRGHHVTIRDLQILAAAESLLTDVRPAVVGDRVHARAGNR